MRIRNKKKYKNQEYLPEKLVIRFTEEFFNDTSYDFRRRNNFLLCIALIFHHQINSENITDYVPLGCAYWKKIFGGNYYINVIEPLLEQSIIDMHDFGYRTFPNAEDYDGTKGLVGKRYRINLSLIDDQFQIIQYINMVSKSATDYILFNNQESISTGIANLNFHISIDQERANKWVRLYAESICQEFYHKNYCDSLPDDLQIEYRESIDGSYNTKFRTVKAARFNASTKNLELFHFKDKFYVSDSKEFIKQHIPTLIYHYKHQIARICTLPIEEKQSPVNLRVHSNLTNFPSKILPYIYINNKTAAQLDLCTSQFLLFANLINVFIDKGEEHLLSLFKHQKTITYLKRLTKILKEPKTNLPDFAIDINNSKTSKYTYSDVNRFIHDVFFNDFYTVVQEELKLPNRLLAKQLLFKLLFKKSNKTDALINKLVNCYKTIMSIIACFKEKDIKKPIVKKGKKKGKKNDDDRESNFSVFLQCVESEIFIDNILQKLRSEGIPCFTRHDSIVVVTGFEKRAEEIARNVFSQFGFRYNHKSEELFWSITDEDELEEGDFMQSVLDESVLNDDSYYDEVDEVVDSEVEDSVDKIVNDSIPVTDIVTLTDHEITTNPVTVTDIETITNPTTITDIETITNPVTAADIETTTNPGTITNHETVTDTYLNPNNYLLESNLTQKITDNNLEIIRKHYIYEMQLNNNEDVDCYFKVYVNMIITLAILEGKTNNLADINQYINTLDTVSSENVHEKISIQSDYLRLNSELVYNYVENL